MRSSRESRNRKILLLLALICAFVASLSNAAGSDASITKPIMSIAVTNDSSRDIHHLYISPVDRDAWGPDLLTEGTVVKPGQTFAVTDVSCAGNEIKIIAEDRQGCFVYGIVGCAQASTGWTITNAMPADCGN